MFSFSPLRNSGQAQLRPFLGPNRSVAVGLTLAVLACGCSSDGPEADGSDSTTTDPDQMASSSSANDDTGSADGAEASGTDNADSSADDSSSATNSSSNVSDEVVSSDSTTFASESDYPITLTTEGAVQSDECAGGSDVDFSMTGWATEGNGTTGGQGGDVITVTDGAALVQALKDKQDSTTPLTILVDGVITEANSGVNKIDIKEVSDVSLLGVGDGAEFDGIGVKIWKSSNIIVRNLLIHNVDIGDKDCIAIEGPSDHIWIDHNELYNELDGVDKDYYDGLLDVKADAEYITYSWNYLHDSWKAALVGRSDGDDFDRKITLHHNHFQNCNSRTPLFRFGNGHLYNNYYEDIASTAVNSRMGACLRVENNYFSNAKNPWVSAYSEALGGAELICNETDNSVFDYSGDDSDEVLGCIGNVPYDYDATLNATEEVPDVVSEYAGVGKLNDPQDF